MGLLDDAIRQHLELKRRHGADPSDVAKLEHEAFGPSARAEPIATPEPGAAATATDTAATAHEPVYDEEPASDEPELETEEERQLPGPVAAPMEAVAEPGEPVEPVAAEREPPAAEPEPLRPGGSIRLDDVGERTLDPPPVEEPDPVEQEPDPQPDAEPGEHDELEETPEFLQETPEHDRLWFEQKPPRDFNF